MHLIFFYSRGFSFDVVSYILEYASLKIGNMFKTMTMTRMTSVWGHTRDVCRPTFLVYKEATLSYTIILVHMWPKHTADVYFFQVHKGLEKPSLGYTYWIKNSLEGFRINYRIFFSNGAPSQFCSVLWKHFLS